MREDAAPDHARDMTVTQTRRAAAGSTQTSWQGRSRPQLPTRDRRTGLFALAVLLVALGAAMSGALVLRSGDRVDVIVTTGRIVAGEEITRDRLGTVSVAVPEAVAVFERGAADEVVGQFAAVDIPEGTLVVAAMLTPERVPGPGQAMVSVALPQSRLPTGALEPGDHVRVLLAPSRGDEASDDLRALADERSVLAEDGRVFTLDRDEITGNTSVSLLLVEEEAEAVALAAAKESVSLIEIPATSDR